MRPKHLAHLAFRVRRPCPFPSLLLDYTLPLLRRPHHQVRRTHDAIVRTIVTINTEPLGCIAKRQQGLRSLRAFCHLGPQLAPSVGWPWTEAEALQFPVLAVPGSGFKLGG